MSKPSILLVPGSFSLPEFYDKVISGVAAKGYEIRGLHYPSVGFKTGPRQGEPATMLDDAAFIAKEVEALADEGKDVILLAHSYGGVPITQSAKGLSKQERQKEGKKGGIVRLLYMTALVVPEGVSASGILETFGDGFRLEFGQDEKGWLQFKDLSAAAALTFSDMPDQEETERLISQFPNHTAASFATELTHAGYKNIPSSYLLCEEDRIIPSKNQRDAVELIERVSQSQVEVTTVQSGHAPHVTKAPEVVDWVLKAAAKHESN
ncbi:alpha/beta-hydrolase [Durotheca rogersii]|uniref:alpha/beta-hydrolase n=1 Tax=Durotheca rogersii TaxID=419775 RepID=UPI00221F0BFD|nr:alpha/beta-hydrolase [Durotheca rogersii]KAI5859405.1 alpha/beta-hydrolase [Durotheca rogersii]